MLKIIEQIARHEGLRLKPYRCTAGKLTIGYGRNLEDNGISQEEAFYMLLHDIKEVEKDLDPFIPKDVTINEARYSVLVNMTFNLGINRILRFKKMWQALNKGDFDKAAEEMLDSLWARQVGNRSIELSEIMRTGEWG